MHDRSVTMLTCLLCAYIIWIQHGDMGCIINNQVSSYAKRGHRSQHNQVYWRGIPYYAFGLGAASFLGGVRFSRPAKMQAYFDWVASLDNSSEPSTMPAAAALPQSEVTFLLDNV